ncbi:MAG TPA: sigma-54 dependent transcriptional regulator [Bauldia sp.]|nr:sigma-54 dependent transcriptional regulator [Bauldia sp.]
MSVLIVDADASARRSLAGMITERSGGRFAPVACATRDEATAAAADAQAIVIADIETVGGPHRLGGIGGRTIATSANPSLATAVAAIRGGAADFLPKPIGAKALIEHLEATLATPAIATPLPAPQKAAESSGDFAGFVGRSQPMRKLYEDIRRVAPSPAPVFITGETGTGKELTAEAIHALSAAGRPFVALNCSAIPRDLMESEMFGHVRGAFTGAGETHIGAAEMADGGILFLDELAEMDGALQAKLLRFVQNGAFRPVGASETKTVKVRIIAATNRDPEAEMAAGRLRADLYYRLNVLPIHLAPLRERREDVPLLADTFHARFAAEEGRDAAPLDADALARLSAYDWPGNVRELANVIRRAIVFGTLDVPDAPARSAAAGGLSVPPVLPFAEQERAIIERALAAFHGNAERAAAALEIAPSTIYRKRAAWAGPRQS